MTKITYVVSAVILILLCQTTHTNAEVNIGIGIGLPNLNIGINLPMFPKLSPVPGYPVYYAPGVNGNYFFYDGMYWVYQDDRWYASSWYNGPWVYIEPETVPSFVLRIPVHYYRQPPAHFRGWQANSAPRWGEHWGKGWEQQRRGWDRWNRKTVHTRAPRPTYQQKYSGSRYPGLEQQNSLHNRSYRYQPKDNHVRQRVENRRDGQVFSPDLHKGRPETPHLRNNEQQHAPGTHEQNRSVQEGQRQEQRSHDRGEDQKQNQGRDQGRSKEDDRGRGHDK